MGIFYTLLSFFGIYSDSLCNVSEHEYKVADASEHHEDVKNFMCSKISVFAIKNFNFKSINNAADGIEDSAG